MRSCVKRAKVLSESKLEFEFKPWLKRRNAAEKSVAEEESNQKMCNPPSYYHESLLEGTGSCRFAAFRSFKIQTSKQQTTCWLSSALLPLVVPYGSRS